MPVQRVGGGPGVTAALCPQYYCCKKDESEEDEEEPDFAVHAHVPPLHSNRNLVLTNGPALYPAASTSFSQRQGRTLSQEKVSRVVSFTPPVTSPHLSPPKPCVLFKVLLSCVRCIVNLNKSLLLLSLLF